MPRKEIAGVETHWSRMGNGVRPALMLHCALASSRAWGPLAQGLDAMLDMTAPDFPGHGRSGPWDGARDYQDLCVEIAGSLRPEGPCDLIGHSFGATVALRLAHAAPQRVRSLTLIEPVFFAAGFADRPDLRAAHETISAPFVQAFARGDMRAAARGFSAVWGDGRPWDSLPEEMRAKMTDRVHMIPATDEALNTDRQGMLLPGGLDHLRSPVLLVEGSDSPEMITMINDALARRLPDARRVMVSGAGHMVPITHAPQVAREIRAMVQETETAPLAQQAE